MHELSIALSIVDMAEEEARRQGATLVKAVHLKVGPLSGVVQEALRFSYGIGCEGTMLEGSALVIEDEPAIIYCDRCEVERALVSIQSFFCPVCSAPASRVVRGNELELIAMEIE